jgi:hypothetical protein
MDREYHIFECLPDGSLIWREKVPGLPSTRLRIDALVNKYGRDYLAFHLPTREVVFHVDPANVAVEASATKRIFHIAYSQQLHLERTELLKQLGYGVLSVIGNDAAKTLLSEIQNVKLTLFIVGYAAPEQTRTEMVDWLKAHFSSVRILALNPPFQKILGADYNAMADEPDEWLSIVSRA